MLVHKYIDRNNLATTVTAQRSAGVTPEVNMRMKVTNHASEGIHLGFETQGRRYQKSKWGITGPIERPDVLQFLKTNPCNYRWFYSDLMKVATYERESLHLILYL